jgi:hypothetical protein
VLFILASRVLDLLKVEGVDDPRLYRRIDPPMLSPIRLQAEGGSMSADAKLALPPTERAETPEARCCRLPERRAIRALTQINQPTQALSDTSLTAS